MQYGFQPASPLLISCLGLGSRTGKKKWIAPCKLMLGDFVRLAIRECNNSWSLGRKYGCNCKDSTKGNLDRPVDWFEESGSSRV